MLFNAIYRPTTTKQTNVQSVVENLEIWSLMSKNVAKRKCQGSMAMIFAIKSIFVSVTSMSILRTNTKEVIFSYVIVARHIHVRWKDTKRFTHINCDYTIQANFFNCYVLPQIVIFLCVAIKWSSQFNSFMLEDRPEFDLLLRLFHTYYFTVLALLSAILKHR